MSTNLGKYFFDHFEKYFKIPIETKVFHSDDLPKIQILEFDRVFKNCRTFASLGMTHFVDELGMTCEVYLPVDDAWTDIPSLLANTIFYMVKSKMTVGNGISISGIQNLNRDFANKYHKSAIYLTNPFGLPESFETVTCGNVTGRIYLAMFISDEEHQYFCDRGSSNLEKLFETKNIDAYHLSRQSCV